MKTITKLARAKFRVVTDNVANSELILDFDPIIKQFNLSGNYLLIHWQAKPRGHRQWGVYFSGTDNYSSLKAIDFNHAVGTTLQLDDAKTETVPSAVIVVKDAQLITLNERAFICNKQQLIDISSGDSV